ncbi:hypothetical protein EJ04DRAFT_393942, partial [Polyplosphaeria fusca]
NTCDWLLRDAQYRAWTSRPQGLFWVKGNPGTGKSVLIKHALESMRKQIPSDLVISFFFHGQGVELQKTPLGLFRALLNLLLEHFLEYLEQLTAKFEDREKRHGAYTADRWKWTDKELQEILFSLLTRGTHHRPTIIFVDALDECGEAAAKSLLKYFKDVMNKAEHENGRVRVCLSSRNYPILDLDTIPAVLVEERNDRDIRWYTRERLKEIQPKLKREQIEEEVLSKAGGGFQWVFLVTETITEKNLKGTKAERLLEELRTCPQTLGELYAAILASVQETEQHHMVKLFQWVIFAERPLSAQELRSALAIDQDSGCTSISKLRAHEGWADTLDDFERYVKDISKGLVHFQSRDIWEQYVPGGEDSDREAQLIHQSVADFLMNSFLSNIDHGQDVFPSHAAAGHFQISRSCLRYLTLDEVLGGAQLPRGILSSRFPLAPYAVRFLFEHIQKVEKEGIIQSDLLSILQWTPKSAIMRKLEGVWRTLDPNSAHTPQGWPFVEATALHVLAASGSKSAVDLTLKTNYDEVDSTDSDGNTPLMLAIREDYQEIALSLLDVLLKQQSQSGTNHITDGSSAKKPLENTHGDLNSRNNDGDTALDIALEQRAGEVILKLIEAGADLKYLGRETALVSYAISSRNTKLLSISIENKLDLDGAVFFALGDRLSQRDSVLEEMVSELLKAGADIARSSKYNRSPELENYDEDESDDEIHGTHDDDALFLASRRGLVGVVDLLLSHNALATRQNYLGECPILVATEGGHVETVQSLLRKEPSSVEIEDSEGRTALTVAIERDQLGLAKLLLREGSFSNSGQFLQELFYSLVEDGVTDVIEIILQKKVINPDDTDDNVQTPLSKAAENGQEAVVKLLLDTGQVDVDSKNKDERTPLLYAARNGHEAVVKLLLDTGRVEVNSRDNYERTPLFWAA